MEKIKFSIFNTVLNITPQSSALYNSKEDKCIIINQDIANLLSYDPADIKKHNPKLFNDLKSIKAVIPESTKELDEVIKKSKEIDKDDTFFKLIINPTMSCNFKCWYCYESHILGSQLKPKMLNRIYKLIDNIFDSNINLKGFMISFFGGEPLMYYNKTTRHIIDYFRSKYDNYKDIEFSVTFTSNGYLLNDDMIEHLTENKESNHFQITLDGGKKEHNKVRDSGKKEGSFDKIIESVKKLISNKIEVLLRINFTYKNIDSTREIIDHLKNISDEDKKYLKICYFRVWQDDTSINVNDKIKDIQNIYKNLGFNVSDDEYVLDNLIHSCYADKKNELLVNFNGDIYKCTARDFNQENKYGTLNENGKVDWIQEKLTEWENIKIQSKACQSCRILPLCGGGCHQINLETKGMDICHMEFDDADKDEVVLNRLSELFVSEKV